MSESPYEAHYKLRDDLVDRLRRDLLGPVGAVDEVLSDDAPITVYPVGVLFPRPADADAGQVDLDARGEFAGQDEAPLASGGPPDDEQPELGVSLANLRTPSSMGITFAVDRTVAPRLRIEIEAARYLPKDAEGNPTAAERAAARSIDQQREYWRRAPLVLAPVAVDLEQVGHHPSIVVHGELELCVLVRPPQGDTVTVTATLVNNARVGRQDLRDAFCYYQPVLTVTGEDDAAAAFVERPTGLRAVDADTALSRLLHRHAPNFAVGHGCSATWKWDPPAPGTPMPTRAATTSVRTEFVPTHEVLLTDSSPTIDTGALAMHHLGTAPAEQIVEALINLVHGYEQWIAERGEEARGLAGTEHEQAAATQLTLCSNALGRMIRGIELLADPERPEVLRAFRLANLAMAEQRSRTSWVKGGKRGRPEVKAGRWRPFQIGFMLQCLEGIVDPEHSDRNIADLLWFPTGGGKTEAYLGLIAFTTFLRRLRLREAGAGVTVLMRYTLRLLTLQQFERAAALICAMERLRAEAPEDLGAQEISIGMWVGRSATPNTLKAAGEKLAELRRDPGRSLTTENPVQLRGCPWCGTALDAGDYAVVEEQARMRICCPNLSCEFHAGLPVHLVDEAVYAARPTLVIATVDKFASLPWRPATAALFNRDGEDDTPPPELIVQDELHLISGPLGTLTGLYETAVDLLAEHPKVIASTATIRRADEQGRNLFCRTVSQFPPGGLDSRDSWFAVESPKEEKAGRRYLGLLTSSTSQATLLVRTFAALLHHAADSNAPDEVRDAYWTLVGYFNSLRLLSAAELQVHDDVGDRLRYLVERDGGKDVRSVEALVELSSRADAGEIPRRLQQIERALPHRDTADVVLATNMISVGVDIDRLGLMTVMGQPQTTAEYIQATSRVGRKHPGLVAVMLNSTRSRDRSHYEGFQHFHSALYREVESTSVTPFSARARDRGLHAVIVALTRHLLPQARPNEAAAQIEGFVAEIDAVVRPAVLQRVAQVDPAQVEATGRAFDTFVGWWRDKAEPAPTLVYEAKRRSSAPALLSGFAEDSSEDDEGWPTLWSLRDVDATAALFLERS